MAHELHDVHIVAGMLKSYLRELPEPMLTFDLYDDWINAMKINDQETRFHAFSEVRAVLITEKLNESLQIFQNKLKNSDKTIQIGIPKKP